MSTIKQVFSVLFFAQRYYSAPDRAAFFCTLIVILNVVIISDLSDSDFEGCLEGSFDIDIIERQHDTVDSDISLEWECFLCSIRL